MVQEEINKWALSVQQSFQLQEQLAIKLWFVGRSHRSEGKAHGALQSGAVVGKGKHIANVACAGGQHG